MAGRRFASDPLQTCSGPFGFVPDPNGAQIGLLPELSKPTPPDVDPIRTLTDSVFNLNMNSSSEVHCGFEFAHNVR